MGVDRTCRGFIRSAAAALSAVVALGLVLTAAGSATFAASEADLAAAQANSRRPARRRAAVMIDTLFAMHTSGYFTWDGLVPGMGYDQVIIGGPGPGRGRGLPACPAKLRRLRHGGRDQRCDHAFRARRGADQ
jgi:hypothetical protein